jgi:hypothetical protein
MCGRLVGKPAANANEADLKAVGRNFGLAYPNTPSGTRMAGEFKGYVQQYCGKQVISTNNEFAYTDDVSRAGDEATTIMVKMHAQGVTSVVNLDSFLYPLFQIVAAHGQKYQPEWTWPCTSYVDTSTIQRLYSGNNNGFADEVDKASFGVTCFGQLGGFYHGPGDAFWVYHKYHQVAPDGKPCDVSSDVGMNHGDESSAAAKFCKAPGAIVTEYYSFLPGVSGMGFAGPDLNPNNVTAGLQNYPETRYGINGPTDDPRAVLVGSNPGKYYFITDASEFRWRANFTSPPPENQLGWVEWPDCQRHYRYWHTGTSGYALQWHPNEPAFNAWCGDPKYAPAASAEKDDYPRYLPSDAGA